MESVFIVAAKRTPIGKFNGSLANVSAVDLGATAIKAVLEESKVKPELLDEVIVGHVLTAGLGMGTGRQAAIEAGIPNTVPAHTLNMICGSGMKSVMEAAAHIKAGDAELVVAAGMESMSNAGWVMNSQARFGVKLGHQALQDTVLCDGLTDAFSNEPMGITAENIAERFAISRQEQDDYALASQTKAQFAIEHGHFSEEIVPVTYTNRKGDHTVDTDEHPSFDSSSVKLAKLRPAFKKEGTVTAGNASGINDGGSAILLASSEAVKKYQLKPLAEIVSYGQGGLDPNYMGLGPVPAIEQALKRANKKLTNIDIFELNEAFAAQSLGVIKELANKHEVSSSWLLSASNLSGGAIALGHPIGASGNRIITTLVHQLHRTDSNFGLASLCIGGGMGTAVILRRCT